MSDFSDAMNDLLASIDARVAELTAARAATSSDLVRSQIDSELGYLARMKAKYAAAKDSGVFKLSNSKFYEPC